MLGSTVSSGINNIANNVLLNLEVDPGKKEINSLIGVVVCYDTRQMTTYPLIMSKTFFTNVMQRKGHWGRGDGIGALGGVFKSK